MTMFSDDIDVLTEENVAAWLDGMMTPEEEREFFSDCTPGSDLALLLDANDDIVDTYESMLSSGYTLPEEMILDFDLPDVPSDLIFSDTPLFDDTDEDPIFADSGLSDTDNDPANNTANSNPAADAFHNSQYQENYASDFSDISEEDNISFKESSVVEDNLNIEDTLDVENTSDIEDTPDFFF
ncbi:MAG: hypothetical protein K2M88_05450 [Muribaculaceae bacterium]|nr:hypothetical protein [Muribaculaceae bacterium]